MVPIQSNNARTIIVTGVGAIIGQGIVKSLRQTGRPFWIVGIDRNAHSMGSYLCDVFYTKPDCDESSPEYFDFWRKILVEESVDLVLPGLEVDLFFLNEHKSLLSATGSILALNRAELIELARDKWLMGLELHKAGLASIPTILSQDWQECIRVFESAPFLLKPRRGNGSRGIVKLYDETDFHYWVNKSTDDFMMQKIVGNDEEEYTVGAFGFGDGDSLKPIIFRRKLSVAGNTQFAEVVSDEIIEQAVYKLSNYFKPIGPTNYQFRMDNGVPYLLEINPRLSSSTSLRTGFGYNEVEMAVDFYLENIKPEVPKISNGLAWRYSDDFLVK
ncbi:Alpha-aminoadipate--LysW ligase LysX [Methylococcales bacterium]|nr:Alpha-aminoadipate--LysW ligase LysX [Methylococcales bacterium]